MKTPLRTNDDCIVADPTHNTSEILPTAWAEYAEQRVPEPEIWPLWRRFKNVTSWPFSKKAWCAYVEAVMRNRQQGRGA
jgi:hypothetical protein